jgi:serine O-acetyltransferase
MTMNPPLRRLRMMISSVRLVPHIIIFLNSSNASTIKADIARWAEILELREARNQFDLTMLFISLMTFLPEYRNLFYLRVGLWSRAFAWMCPRLWDLDIGRTDIGPGLFIQHGNSTFISARKIGDNCWIGRHVVIGFSNDTDRPTLGNNVRIFAGAKLIGNVTIGDNATVGLNTVVIDNVPANATVLGVPGRIIWKPKQAE